VRRYINIGLFGLVLLVALRLLEASLVATKAGISIFDSNGAGQVLLLATTLALIVLFSKFIAKSAPFGVMAPYFTNWKRSLAGLGQFYLATIMIVILAYVCFALQGGVFLSSQAVSAFSFDVAEDAIVALLVVFVLALTEELMFRNFLMRYLMWDDGRLAAITAVISASLIFAFLHNLTEPLAWFSAEKFPLFVGLFILGSLLCVTYISTGSILCAVGLHAGFLGSKVFLRKTQLLTVDPQVLMVSSGPDLRTSPLVWALWIVMGIAIYFMRGRLRQRFAIEYNLSETRANP
jgi:membrane protease YdiL (CAAX protease family)